MTAGAFRKLALALPGAVEASHMDHPDFRTAGGKIFASLGYPDVEHGMVKLTPEQQADFIERAPQTFAPCRGAWGLRGATCVYLESAAKTVLHAAMEAAWRNASAPARSSGRPRAVERTPIHPAPRR